MQSGTHLLFKIFSYGPQIRQSLVFRIFNPPNLKQSLGAKQEREPQPEPVQKSLSDTIPRPDRFGTELTNFFVPKN